MLELNAAVTVDLVVLTVRDDELHVLLVRRGLSPYKDRWALPGGFVLPGEDLADAATRELAEETGLGSVRAYLEQLATYGAPRRDPRGRVVTVAYLALLPDVPVPTAGSDAAAARWEPASGFARAAATAASARSAAARTPATATTMTSATSTTSATAKSRRALAFDHETILADGIERARAKLEYAPVAPAFCRPEFTVAELRRVYEAVWDQRLDPRNFHRKVTSVEGFLVPTGESTTRDGGRPAQLYRAGQPRLLYPPMLRG